jgi:hypothetical protein
MGSRAVRFAGAAAFALAAITALAALAYVLLPAEQRLGVPGRQLLPSFDANPLPLQFEMLFLAAMGVVGLAIVGPIRELVDAEHPVLRWTAILALVGYAVAAVGNTLTMGKLPGIAAAFVRADDAQKPTIAAFWRTTLDPFGLWQFGAVGVFILVVGLVALRSGGALPKVSAYLAIAAGLAHLAIPLVLVSSAQPVLAFVAVVAAVLMVAWFAWLGSFLWRRGGGTAPA